MVLMCLASLLVLFSVSRIRLSPARFPTTMFTNMTAAAVSAMAVMAKKGSAGISSSIRRPIELGRATIA